MIIFFLYTYVFYCFCFVYLRLFKLGTEGQPMAGLQCHAIKKILVQRLQCDKWLIFKQPHQDLDVSGHSFTHHWEKCFNQIYRALYADSMLVPIQMGTNMATISYTNICHWVLPSKWNISTLELQNIKINTSSSWVSLIGLWTAWPRSSTFSLN